MSHTDESDLQRFSRYELERSSEPDVLGAALRDVLLPRLRAAANPAEEARAIVADLRRAGHDLWSWDESTDFSIWGDDYGRPSLPTRFLIQMRWPSEDEPGQGFDVEITLGLWPRDG